MTRQFSRWRHKAGALAIAVGVAIYCAWFWRMLVIEPVVKWVRGWGW